MLDDQGRPDPLGIAMVRPATIEALAILVSLRLFFGDDPGFHHVLVAEATVQPCVRCTHGDGFVLRKHVDKGIVQWTPREANREAD